MTSVSAPDAADFLVHLKKDKPLTLILEIKGYDPLEDVKKAAAARWVAAVNAEGSYCAWTYAVAKKPTEVSAAIDAALKVS